jgi:hypothetical protein
MKIDYDPKIDLIKKGWVDAEKVMAKAGSAAIYDVGNLARARGRAHLGAAGFKDGYFPWQKAWEAEFFPRSGKDSIRAAVRVGHNKKMGIASVFEHGTTVKPRSNALLWIPIMENHTDDRPTPRKFRHKLYRVNRPGKAPLLVGKAGGGKKNLPLFVGIKQAKMPKRLRLYAIIKAAADQLSALYTKNLRVD